MKILTYFLLIILIMFDVLNKNYAIMCKDDKVELQYVVRTSKSSLFFQMKKTRYTVLPMADISLNV